MEHSQSGYIEPMTRRSRANAARVQAVLHAISDRFTGDAFPAMSDHYVQPEFPYQPELPFAEPLTVPVLEKTPLAQAAFIQVTDRLHGWDSEGRYL